MNYSEIKKSLLRILRGAKSQSQMSALLGYSYNKYHRWETEKDRFLWTDFIGLLEANEIEFPDIFEKNVRFNGDIKSKEFFAFFMPQSDQKDEQAIATALKTSPSTLRRWRNGEAVPTFEKTLELLEFKVSNLDVVLSEIAPDLLTTTELGEKILRKNKLNEIYVSQPEISLIICLLDSSEYKDLKQHSDAFIAERLGEDPKVIQESMALLEENNIIFKKSNKFLVNVETLDAIHLSKEQFFEISQFWALRNLSKIKSQLEDLPEMNRATFSVFNLDESKIPQFKEAWLQFYNEVYQLQKTSSQKDKIFSLTMQLADLI